MIMTVFIIAAVGFALSLYGLFVEQKIKTNPAYKPVCDLSDRVSCSKPFLSPYGKLIKMPNRVLGLLFYAGMMLLAWCDYAELLWYGSVLSVLVSAVLAYILYFKIKALCLLCTSIYFVNLVLLYATYLSR